MGLVGKGSKKLNILITLIIWCVLCSTSMACMLVVASDKAIVIEDAAQRRAEFPTDSKPTGIMPGVLLELQANASMDNRLCIPIEEGTKAEHVTVENRYAEQELWIYIKEAEKAFYQQNIITGDVSPVIECWYEEQKDGLLIKMKMDTVWEYHSIMENGSLQIAYANPHDTYQQIVVIDPIGGGSESGIVADRYAEKKLALQVAKLVQKKVEQPEIKIYVTRSEDDDISREQRVAIVEAVEPDLFLQIGASESDDIEQYGIQTFYNDEYYMPDFGNVEWADIVTKSVTVAASNRALGLFPVEEDSILKQMDMPAASIRLGYLTNNQENSLLRQESYQEKLAEGIAEAILEVYTNTCVQK